MKPQLSLKAAANFKHHSTQTVAKQIITKDCGWCSDLLIWRLRLSLPLPVGEKRLYFCRRFAICATSSLNAFFPSQPPKWLRESVFIPSSDQKGPFLYQSVVCETAYLYNFPWIERFFHSHHQHGSHRPIICPPAACLSNQPPMVQRLNISHHQHEQRYHAKRAYHLPSAVWD